MTLVSLRVFLPHLLGNSVSLVHVSDISTLGLFGLALDGDSVSTGTVGIPMVQ